MYYKGHVFSFIRFTNYLFLLWKLHMCEQSIYYTTPNFFVSKVGQLENNTQLTYKYFPMKLP